ncbi:MAG: hypothetical protein QNJ97_24825 [Myxococcota bacterium]|nr:hypothetical protein [Myxococcota bacterium]
MKTIRFTTVLTIALVMTISMTQSAFAAIHTAYPGRIMVGHNATTDWGVNYSYGGSVYNDSSNEDIIVIAALPRRFPMATDGIYVIVHYWQQSTSTRVNCRVGVSEFDPRPLPGGQTPIWVTRYIIGSPGDNSMSFTVDLHEGLVDPDEGYGGYFLTCTLPHRVSGQVTGHVYQIEVWEY